MVTAVYDVELSGCVCSYESTRVEAYASYSNFPPAALRHTTISAQSCVADNLAA